MTLTYAPAPTQNHPNLNVIETFTTQEKLSEVNKTIIARRNSKRDIITYTLKLGRLLTELKAANAHGGHGNWTNFVMERFSYRNIREAQLDMRFWRFWEPYIAQLQEVAVVGALDGPEKAFVTKFTDDNVTAAFSAMNQFADDSLPEYTFDLAIELMREQDGYLSGRDASAIIKATKTVEELPEQYKPLGKKLLNQGVRNTDVIAAVPKLAEDEDLVEQIESSGTIFVPGTEETGDGESIRLSELSKTDIKLVLNKHNANRKLNEYITRETAKGYDFVTTLHAESIPELIQLLSELDIEEVERFDFKMTLSKREKPKKLGDVTIRVSI